MIKRFLLTITTLLLLTSSVYAGNLGFSVASVLIQCSDQDSARNLVTVAQTRPPTRADMGSCQPVGGFGSPIDTQFVSRLVLDSPIMDDWEGDEFAIFSIDLDNKTYWLIIYNPKNLNQQAAI